MSIPIFIPLTTASPAAGPLWINVRSISAIKAITLTSTTTETLIYTMALETFRVAEPPEDVLHRMAQALNAAASLTPPLPPGASPQGA